MFSFLDVATTDPATNLALEQYVFDCFPRDRTWFLLWQNEPSVIIGRHQDVLAEINQAYVREHGIKVVRRLSGGGAVYHDLGNLNYSFIMEAGDVEQMNLSLLTRPLIGTLKELGIEAQATGRNDVTIKGQKISGNAQYIRKGRLLHHGTILFDADLEAMEKALKASPDKLHSKGIRSVRSRVTNVREHLGEKQLDLPAFRRLFLRHVLSQMGDQPCLPSPKESTASGGRPYLPAEEDLAAVAAICKARYASWDWNFGQSPEGTMVKRRRFEGCGEVEAWICLEKGRIKSLTFKGDFFSREDPDVLAGYLTGLKPEVEACERALSGVDVSRYIVGLTSADLARLLLE